MIDILEQYKQYLPSKTVQLNEKIPGSDDTEDATYIKTLLGGDYLSVARVRGGSIYKKNSRIRKTLFLPTVEDWHAKLCFLEVITFVIILYT